VNRAKYLLIFIMTALSVFLFMGCNAYEGQEISNESQDADVYITLNDAEADKCEILIWYEWWREFSQRYSVFGRYAGIRVADDEFLSKFEYVYEIGAYVCYTYNVVIWATDNPLAGFEFSYVIDGNCGAWDDFFYVQGEVLFSIDVLPQGHAVLFRGNPGRSGWHPGYAISFIDTDEKRRYVGIVADLSGEVAPYLFAEFALSEGKPPFALPPWNDNQFTEFITLPNGTSVDTRVDNEVVDLILRHFAAIEAGDALAFWDTLGGGQDGVSHNYWRSLVFRYFPQWFIENDGNAGDFFNPDAGLPPSLHSTGLRVSKIEQLLECEEGFLFAIQATVINDYGFREIFVLGIVSEDWLPYGIAIVGHSPGPDFNIEWFE